MAIQTAGSSNPNAGAEGQLAGLKNATVFRDRLLAARDALTGNTGAVAAASPLALGSMQYVSVPSAAHSMQHGGSSPELQQLQEINAGIKQASRTDFSLIFVFLRRLCRCARALLPDECAAAGGPAADSKHSLQILRRLILHFIIACSHVLQINCVPRAALLLLPD